MVEKRQLTLNILISTSSPLPPRILDEIKDEEVLYKRRDEILSAIASKNYDIIVIDDDMELLRAIKGQDSRPEVLLFGDGRVDVVEAVREGASGYFGADVAPEEFRKLIERIRELVALRVETATLERELTRKYTFKGIVGRNPYMLEIFHFIRRIAPYYRTVTIIGETGTGKELIARAIHEASPVREEPFVTFNCGGVVDTLIESELFGHKKGAFTGAVADKKGLFETAGRGTIFLDEIGELPLSVQPHLLRVLQNGEFRPVGSNRTFRAECRVIAATNKDLWEEVKAGRFREDLYYRLTPITLNLPPLRERKDDIPLLLRHFLAEFSKRTGKRITGISRQAQRILIAYSWPGNVRELENVIERAAILAKESFIRVEDLPAYIKDSLQEDQPIQPDLTLDEVVKRHIQSVLRRCNGNRTKASQILGISRRALIRKLQKYSID